MSETAKVVEHGNALREHGHEGPRWIPIAAASLAVLAAVSGFVSNVLSTKALFAKNEAIILTTNSSDKYSQYQAGRIKFYIYTAAIESGTSRNVDKLQQTADRENKKTKPLLKEAGALVGEAKVQSERSEKLLTGHEIIEVATTLFEVSIVLVSITALLGSRILPIGAGIASGIGAIVFVIGLLFAR